MYTCLFIVLSMPIFTFDNDDDKMYVKVLKSFP